MQGKTLGRRTWTNCSHNSACCVRKDGERSYKTNARSVNSGRQMFNTMLPNHMRFTSQMELKHTVFCAEHRKEAHIWEPPGFLRVLGNDGDSASVGVRSGMSDTWVTIDVLPSVCGPQTKKSSDWPMTSVQKPNGCFIAHDSVSYWALSCRTSHS